MLTVGVDVACADSVPCARFVHQLLEPSEPTELDATIMCMAMVFSEAEAAAESTDSDSDDY